MKKQGKDLILNSAPTCDNMSSCTFLAFAYATSMALLLSRRSCIASSRHSSALCTNRLLMMRTGLTSLSKLRKRPPFDALSARPHAAGRLMPGLQATTTAATPGSHRLTSSAPEDAGGNQPSLVQRKNGPSHCGHGCASLGQMLTMAVLIKCFWGDMGNHNLASGNAERNSSTEVLLTLTSCTPEAINKDRTNHNIV